MFKHAISLGNNCATAASLSKHGLRGCSAPFDWVLTDFESLICCLESDFDDFLNIYNIEKIEGDRPKSFKDKKYNITFMHEVDYNFKEEFEAIKSKYQRRIAEFRKDIKENTCFVRTVFDEKELKYIVENEGRIKNVVKKYNSENEIIFLIPNYLTEPKECRFKFFMIDVETYRGNIHILRSIFDSNDMLVKYLVENFDKKNRVKNLNFDMKKEYNRLKLVEKEYSILLRILKIDKLSNISNKKVAIYGFNENSKELYNKIFENCVITCFIDSNPKEKQYRDSPIILIDDYSEMDDVTIIVMDVNEIDRFSCYLEKIWSRKGTKIISIEKFLDYLNI